VIEQPTVETVTFTVRLPVCQGQ